MPTGPSPNSSPENNLPLSSDALSTNSASHRSPPALPKPRAASSAPGALARTVWSANFASPTPPLWSQPIPCSPASAPTTTSASPVPPPPPPLWDPANPVLARFCADYTQRFARPPAQAACDFRSLPRRFDLARCLALHYQRVVAPDHPVTLGAYAIALPPLPGPRGYAGETVELSHQLEGTLRVYRGDVL